MTRTRAFKITAQPELRANVYALCLCVKYLFVYSAFHVGYRGQPALMSMFRLLESSSLWCSVRHVHKMCLLPPPPPPPPPPPHTPWAQNENQEWDHPVSLLNKAVHSTLRTEVVRVLPGRYFNEIPWRLFQNGLLLIILGRQSDVRLPNLTCHMIHTSTLG